MKNDKQYCENYMQFFTNCLIELKRHNVDIQLTNNTNIKLKDENTYSRGCWDDESDPDKPVLKCSVSGDIEEWLSIFAHEYCHFLQWKEKNKAWKHYNKLNGDDLVKVLNNKPIKYNVLKNCLDVSIEVELDCEVKTVQIIKHNKLPIDIEKYIKGANVYLYFYRYIETYRHWYPRGHEPYLNPLLLKAAPSAFCNSYEKIPNEMLKLFTQLYPVKEKSKIII